MDLIPSAPQVFTPPATPLPEPKSKIWMWIGVCALMLALGIGIGVVLARYAYQKTTGVVTTSSVPTPTPDPTANWKTYTNTVYRYSIKYPPAWQTQGAMGGYINVGPDALELKIINPDSSKLYPDGVIFISNAFSPTYGPDWKKTLVIMNGIEFSKFEKEVKKDLQSTVFVTKTSSKPDYDYGDSYLEITLQYSLTNPEKDIVDQILSTFRFLNEKSIYTCPASGWVDCMPILDEAKQKACSPEAMEWYKANCPNFKGAAY